MAEVIVCCLSKFSFLQKIAKIFLFELISPSP